MSDIPEERVLCCGEAIRESVEGIIRLNSNLKERRMELVRALIKRLRIMYKDRPTAEMPSSEALCAECTEMLMEYVQIN